ncbi:MAG TPA: hypothetical protein VKQ72_14260 [Aggregatilineales bacterium]|nr:hypothetical protein [Aggregatilineales bacterium]
MSDHKNFADLILRFLRRHVFTRENLWVIVVAVMLLAILVLGTMGVQPRFVYSGF